MDLLYHSRHNGRDRNYECDRGRTRNKHWPLPVCCMHRVAITNSLPQDILLPNSAEKCSKIHDRKMANNSDCQELHSFTYITAWKLAQKESVSQPIKHIYITPQVHYSVPTTQLDWKATLLSNTVIFRRCGGGQWWFVLFLASYLRQHAIWKFTKIYQRQHWMRTLRICGVLGPAL